MIGIKATAGGLAVSALLIICGLGAASPAAAQSPEEFYKGKTITIVLGHPPGGSYDLYARLAADHMKRFIPGNPNIIVQHRPGGGGVAAVRWFHAQAPRDGTTMGLFTETIGHTQLLTPEQGKWKVEEMTYIGTFAPSNAAFVIRKGAPAITADAMRKTPVTVACTGVNSQSYQYPASLKELGGFKFIIVCGYPGSAEVMLAIHRAEADMFSGSWHVWRATQQAGLKDGSLIPVIQGGLTRTRDLPERAADAGTGQRCARQEGHRVHLRGLGDRPRADRAARRAGRPDRGVARGVRQARGGSGVPGRRRQAHGRYRAVAGRGRARLQRRHREGAEGHHRSGGDGDGGREEEVASCPGL